MQFYIIKCYDNKYKIGFLSEQYIESEVPCILMLADIYALGEKSPYGPEVKNEFNTFWEAKKAVDALNKK